GVRPALRATRGPSGQPDALAPHAAHGPRHHHRIPGGALPLRAARRTARPHTFRDLQGRPPARQGARGLLARAVLEDERLYARPRAPGGTTGPRRGLRPLREVAGLRLPQPGLLRDVSPGPRLRDRRAGDRTRQEALL
ncbi:MAG: hypothetical protein AVDCRST_MAG02-3554, partial [uncultured Rubrobacteraceae bacterium]